MTRETIIFAISSDNCRMGKDTCADEIYKYAKSKYIKNMRNREIAICSLASALKKDVCEKYNLDINKMINDDAYKAEHRHLLIKHGQEERAKDKDVWVKKLFLNISKIFNRNSKSIIAIPDIRFNNEIDYIINRFFIDEKTENIKCKLVHIHITAHPSGMLKRITGDNDDISKYNEWEKLMDDTSEKDFIVGKTIGWGKNNDIDYILSNNKDEETFRRMIHPIVDFEWNRKAEF